MFEVLYVDVVWSCRVVVLAAFDCCLDLLGCDVYLSIGLVIFLFVVLDFVRYSVNELFVEGTCDVFMVTDCVVFECYGVVVLLCLSFVC